MPTATIPRATRSPPSSATSAQRLRTMMAAVRVSLRWFGVRKTLTTEQKAQAAETFGAESPFLSAAKRILDVRQAPFRAVTAVRTKVMDYWRRQTLPFPEKGIRLLPQDRIEAFHNQLGEYQQELADAVADLDDHYAELRGAAAIQLGALYNPADYPATLIGLFEVSWDFPSIDAPDFLRQLHPALFEQEQQRVAARFEEAVRLAEQAFMDEFAQLINHLTERLSPDAEGKTKVFRDTALTNVLEFFEQFKSLGVHSHAQLDELVGQAQNLVRGVAPQTLRDQADLRRQLAGQLSGVQAALDGMLIDRPRRRVIRGMPNGGESP